MPTPPARRASRLALLTTAVVVALAPALVSVAPAWAEARVTIVNDSGGSTADPDFATNVTVSGSGFQSITRGFGGVYVLFGWVDDAAGGSWAPSRGGVVGQDYRYIPDSESKDNAGFQRFVSFPGSETEAAAHAIMDADGAWTVTMVIPSAGFTSHDRDGNEASVDCLEVQCGIITIGAHGVKNANNETFTPIEFAAPGSGEAAAAAPAPDAAVPAAAPGSARVGFRPETAVAGGALAFTGQGFTPGEQVVATLDGDAAAVGPLTAGMAGDVAGVLQLPADLRSGTHLLSVRGAASGTVAESEVTIEARDAAPSAIGTVEAEAPELWPYLLLGSSIALAAALLIASIVAAIVRARRARRAARDAADRAPAAVEPDVSSTGAAAGPRAGSWEAVVAGAAAASAGHSGEVTDSSTSAEPETLRIPLSEDETPTREIAGLR